MARGDVVIFKQRGNQYFVYNTNKDPFLCKLFNFRINYGVSNNNLNSVLQKLSAQGYQHQIIGQSSSTTKPSGKRGTSFIAPTKPKPKPNAGTKSTSYGGPYERSGYGWDDDTWTPGLPSSRFYRKRKH